MEQIVQLNSNAKLSEHFTLGEMTKSSSHPDQAQRVERSLDYARDDRRGDGRDDKEEPILINSGYRSPQLNKKIGGVPTSNHLTGCAVDIRVTGMEQLIRYANILLDYADESHQDFDELLIERNRYGAIWLHFAVRAKGNRRKVAFINA